MGGDGAEGTQARRQRGNPTLVPYMMIVSLSHCGKTACKEDGARLRGGGSDFPARRQQRRTFLCPWKNSHMCILYFYDLHNSAAYSLFKLYNYFQETSLHMYYL